MKPNWIDMLAYRFYRWRWNRILAARPDLRELFIAYMKAFDVVDDGDQVDVTVTISKGTDNART